MGYKTPGNTGPLVPQLCLGAMTWEAIGNVGQAGADALVKAALDAGINFFDTADVYSEGESEKALTKPAVTPVIVGARRVNQLQDNLAAVDLQLAQDEIKQLDDVSALPAEYLGWMLPRQSATRLHPPPRA